MPSSFIVVPIACLVLATIFSPINLYAVPSLGDYPANQFQNANGANIAFGNNSYINIGINGINYGSSSSLSNPNSIACENITITPQQAPGQTTTPTPQTIGQLPIIGWLLNGNGIAGINILRNFQEFITGIGDRLVGHKNIANACLQQAGTLVQGNIISIKYDGTDLILFFIDLMLIVLGATVVVGIFAGSSAFVAFIVGALASIWLVLSLFATPTFWSIPNPWGATLYILLTLGFTIGSIDVVGGGKVL